MLAAVYHKTHLSKSRFWLKNSFSFATFDCGTGSASPFESRSVVNVSVRLCVCLCVCAVD